jgi:replication initiator protein A
MIRKDLHPNLDFFVADIWSWALKDDQASMEHPMFSLSKSPDFELHRYEHGGHSITIAPSFYGHPTIWDKDVLIYCCSQLIAGMREGREPQQVIRWPRSPDRPLDILDTSLMDERLQGNPLKVNILIFSDILSCSFVSH